MSIILYGKHSDRTEEIFFGRHGFKRVTCRGRLVRVVHPDGRKIREGSVVRLSLKARSQHSGHGLTDIPLGSLGRIRGFDFLTKSERILRVVFDEDKRKGVVSVSFIEIEIVNY